jgi:hypothetical protein
MKKLLRITLFVTTVILLSTIVSVVFAQTAEEKHSGVKNSWEEAEVYVPGKMFATTPSKVSVDKPLPVVIYLHGCMGISPDNDVRWGRFFMEAGFIAILPNSMARPGRIPNCNPRTKKGGDFPQAHAMRQEEIQFAVEQLKNCTWVDKKNIYLMGHSEGGRAVSCNRLEGFRGIIISGWHCTNIEKTDFDGIFAPIDTPILTLEWEHDSWLSGTPRDGSCINKFGERKKARQVWLKGYGHDTSWEREAREAVVQFIKEEIVP